MKILMINNIMVTICIYLYKKHDIVKTQPIAGEE